MHAWPPARLSSSVPVDASLTGPGGRPPAPASVMCLPQALVCCGVLHQSACVGRGEALSMCQCGAVCCSVGLMRILAPTGDEHTMLAVLSRAAIAQPKAALGRNPLVWCAAPDPSCLLAESSVLWAGMGGPAAQLCPSGNQGCNPIEPKAAVVHPMRDGATDLVKPAARSAPWWPDAVAKRDCVTNPDRFASQSAVWWLDAIVFAADSAVAISLSVWCRFGGRGTPSKRPVSARAAVWAGANCAGDTRPGADCLVESEGVPSAQLVCVWAAVWGNAVH